MIIQDDPKQAEEEREKMMAQAKKDKRNEKKRKYLKNKKARLQELQQTNDFDLQIYELQ